jgi:hypothetical protein
VDTPALRRPERGGEEERLLERFDQIVGARAQNPDGLALLRFCQRKVLREVYKLAPQRMAELVKNFGALDWRGVDAQSLYWVAQGLEMGGETLNTFENDKTNTARILFFSLRNLYQRNRIRFEPNPDDVFKSYLNLTPDLNFIEPMQRAFTTYGPMIDPDPGEQGGAGDMFRAGHVTFLIESIRMLYFADRVAEAQHYYDYLRQTYARLPGGGIDDRYVLPLHDFVVQTFYGNIDGPRETQAAVADLLYQAYGDLADDDVESYNRLVAKALDFHRAYMRGHERDTGPRMKLLPFQDYQIEVLRTWLAAPASSDAELLRKARLWLQAPPRLKQWVYDDLSTWFARECQAWGFDAARAFPAPPAMDEFRQQHPRREAQRPERTADTPAQPR